jgi:hypothetical protein
VRIGNRRDPAAVLLLSIITCGIYYLYFIYKVTEEIADYQGKRDRSPGMEVLLTVITFGIWNIYWDYRVGKSIVDMSEAVGLQIADNAILFLILDLVGVGVTNGLIEQDSLNRIWDAARTH